MKKKENQVVPTPKNPLNIEITSTMGACAPGYNATGGQEIFRREKCKGQLSNPSYYKMSRLKHARVTVGHEESSSLNGGGRGESFEKETNRTSGSWGSGSFWGRERTLRISITPSWNIPRKREVI